MAILHALGATLTYMLGIAVSPLPIIAVLIILMGNRAKASGISFTLGWIVSVLGMIYLAIRLGSTFQNSQPNAFEGIMALVIGVLFIWVGVNSAKKAYRDRANPHLPDWMRKIDSYKAGSAFVLAFALNLVNVKNIPLSAQAVSAVGEVTRSRSEPLTTTEQWVVAIIFAIGTSLPMLIPTLWRIWGGDKARQAMGRMKAVLEKYNNIIMAILFLMMGSQAIGGAIQVLANLQDR